MDQAGTEPMTHSGSAQDPPLTRKAVLTFLSQMLEQGAGMISGLLFTPIIVHGLGKDLYGAWGMITRLTGFLGYGSLNAMSILKLMLGVRQHNDDIAEKRRLIGAALVQWLILSPVILVPGALLIYYSPQIIRIHLDSVTPLRWALAIMVINVPLTQIGALPGSVLAGQNLHYKAMGTNAVMILLAGVLNALGILAGFGIITLALTTLLGIILVSGVRWVIARRTIGWFGIDKPRRQEVVETTKLSLWGTLTSLAGQLLTSTDAIIIGIMFSPAVVTEYIVTGALVRFIFIPLQQLLRSGNAGIGYLAGCGKWEHISRLRIELHQTALWGFCVAGSVILLLNQSFIHLWMGKDFFGGNLLSLFIILWALARQLANIDSIPLDAILKLLPKLIVMLVWSVIGIVAGMGLARVMGLPGVPAGMALGYLGMWLGFQELIRRYTHIPLLPFVEAMLKPLIIAILVMVVCLVVRGTHFFAVSSWLSLVLAGAGVAITVGLLFAFAGLSVAVRSSLVSRFRTLTIK
jgi:O-antigen/teichoic acid export membrane protein